MFTTKPYDQINVEMYNAIQEDLSSKLNLMSERVYAGHIEELYRFEDTEYYLEVFYRVPNQMVLLKDKQELIKDYVSPPKFGIFNNETCEPVTLDSAIQRLPEEFRKLICFNMDRFSEMKDVFRDYEAL